MRVEGAGGGRTVMVRAVGASKFRSSATMPMLRALQNESPGQNTFNPPYSQHQGPVAQVFHGGSPAAAVGPGYICVRMRISLPAAAISGPLLLDSHSLRHSCEPGELPRCAG